MFCTFGSGKIAFYGKITSIPRNTLDLYEVEILQPEDVKGQVVEVAYDCLKFLPPSCDPKNWEEITSHLNLEISKISTRGNVIKMFDSRFKTPGKLIGSFLPNGRFLFFDEFARQHYFITEGGLSKKKLQSFFWDYSNSLMVYLKCDCFKVFAEKI